MAKQVMNQSTLKRLITAVSGAKAGNELASLIENGNALAAASTWAVPAVIVATSTSTTTNFGVLQVGDIVVHVPAAAGNSDFTQTATAGTLAESAVIGDLYVVLRAFAVPTAHNYKL